MNKTSLAAGHKFFQSLWLDWDSVLKGTHAGKATSISTCDRWLLLYNTVSKRLANQQFFEPTTVASVE